MLKTLKFYINKIPLLFISAFPSFQQRYFLNTTSEKDCFAYSQTFHKYELCDTNIKLMLMSLKSIFISHIHTPQKSVGILSNDVGRIIRLYSMMHTV